MRTILMLKKKEKESEIQYMKEKGTGEDIKSDT